MKCSFLVILSLLLAGCSWPGSASEVPDQGETLLLHAMLPQSITKGPSGFLLGKPVGITSNTQDGAVMIKSAGFTAGGPPSGWPSSLPLPDFSQFPGDCFDGVADLTVTSPVLAMSMGLDVIVMDLQELQIGASLDGAQLTAPLPVAVAQVSASHGWMALDFSVDSSQIGTSTGLAPDIAALLGDPALDRTVFSYVIPGSIVELLAIENESVMAMDASVLEMSGTSEIHGLSMHMALYYTDLTQYPNVFTTRALSDDPWIYFTLRPEFLADPNVSGAIAAAWGGAPDSATIYMSHWSGTQWQRPVVYATATELGFRPDSWHERPVIDGLAIDAAKPGTQASAAAADEIMFSLASTANNQVPAEMQIQYVRPGGDRRRVVVPTLVPEVNYGSLGKTIKAGRGIGDFCLEDPFWRKGQEVNTTEYVLDDFFIARRLPPATTHVVPYEVPAFEWPRFKMNREPFGPTRLRELGPLVVNGNVVLPELNSPVLIFPQPLVLIPGAEIFELDVVPQLALAVSGYRHMREGKNVMRTCMSWPRAFASSGKATVKWGRMAKFHGGAESIEWFDEQLMDYNGQQLIADHLLELDGLLRTPKAAPAGVDDKARALAAQWQLVAGGKVYISPVSVLRY